MKLPLRLALLLMMSFGAIKIYAQDLTVNFTATIKDTTCAMTVIALNGANLSGDSTANDYYLDFPTMGISDIVNKSALTEASFKIMPQNCNNYVSSLSMTINGTISGYTPSLIVTDSSISGHTNYAGVGFKRMSADDTQRFTLNGSQNISWTRDEIINGLDLTGIIRQTTSAGTITPGVLQAKATFVFTYN
ncbi:fimbrial protein [[Enterobacter] lignolyticus]|uniref:Fimbrial protein n=1 Tax=[Enterobacter] lignolyticus TaxID=1334193 RepID=A0A806XA57_9ENTR|nr:fimbrial protein [[Enterobacter] lignolyticus]ALR75491.1 fimbrial protein [[Enterobacter] lignolyticus]